MGRRALTGFLAFALVVCSLPLAAMPAAAVSPDIVISQVYGGGGNAGAPYQNDFIELFNRGAARGVNGWSVQYASAGGTTWQVTNLPNVSIPAGGYLLIREAAGNSCSGLPCGVVLPTPDATGTIPMSATSGKVALVSTTAALTGSGCPFGATIVDFIGFGSSANCFEDGGPTTNLSNTNAAIRLGSGCVDSDRNNADFTVSAPTPRNSLTAAFVCGSDLPPSVAATSPADGATEVAPTSTVQITFSEPVLVATGWYSIVCTTSGTHSAATSGGPTTFTLTPSPVFANDESCTVTIVAAKVSDIDAGQHMAADVSFSFTVFLSLTAIHTIQGSARNTALAGQIRKTRGIVTAVKNNGFFVEASDNDMDSDPATSEGIFVFTGSPVPSAAVIGNQVEVIAKVQNFVPGSDPLSPAVTELSGGPTVTVLTTGNPMPTAITLTSANYQPSGGIDQLVRYEGMLVHIGDLLDVVSPSSESQDEKNATSTTTGSFYAVFDGVARPFREPGIETPEPNPPAFSSAPNIPTYDANPERVRIDTSGIGALDLTTGATVQNITGALDFIFRSYSIFITQPGVVTTNGITASMPVRMPQPYEFTVASANMERFFDTVDDAGVSDVKLTALAFNNRLNKASLELRNVLHTPDIVGVEEVENLGALQALAAKINNDAIAAGDANPQYVAYLQEGNDIGGIDSGFLVKSSHVHVTSVTQYGRVATYIDPNTGLPFQENGGDAVLNDRPPLVLVGEIHSVVGPDYPVTVIVNHLRSLSGLTGADAWRISNKRKAQAEFLANLIQGFQSADPSAHIISIGDYNAYQFNDGYVDSIGTIKGTPTPAAQVELASPDLVNPDLIDLVDTVPADQQYSFMFDGNAQELDHVLITRNLSQRVIELEYARNNADFGAAYRNDPNRPERISDHDPIVAYFSFPPQITAPTDISTVTGPGATTCAATVNVGTPTVFGWAPLSVTPNPAPTTFPVGTTTVVWTVTDAGGTSASASELVSVSDNTVPLIAAPAHVTRPATGVTTVISDADLGTPTASDNCGVVSVTRTGVPSGNQFPQGTTTITYIATDGSGNTATATQTVTLVPTTTSVCATVRSVVSNAGEANSLCSKLDAAAAAATRGNTTAKKNQIQAFMNEVNAQRGKAITEENADALIALAGAL